MRLPAIPHLHPLFDLSTTYSRMQGSGRPDLKMTGYFHMLWGDSELRGDPMPQASPRSEQERRDLTRQIQIPSRLMRRPGPEAEVLDALRVKATALFLGMSDAPAPRLPATAELCLVREADASISVGLLAWLDEPAPDLASTFRYFRCRAFPLEPGAVRRIEEALGGGTYLDAFEPGPIVDKLLVAQLLAACSTFEGDWSPGDDALRFLRLTISDRYKLLPPRHEPLSVVLALHPV